MAIKPEANKYFDNGFEGERELAGHLDEAFDVTFRDTRGGFAFWFADPKQITQERFGLQQEVLVIFSPYLKTDARVLTAIENVVRAPEFKHRVDRVVFLLIHKGEIEQTQNLVKSSVDRIIVPIRVDDLMDNNRGPFFLRSKLAEAIGTIDLFGMTSAITSDKYFFGRNELVQSLISRSTVSMQNSGLFGLRKTGKTSVLCAMQRRLEGKPILAEYVECSNPGIHSARWWQLLEVIVKKCSETASKSFDENIIIKTDYTPSNAGNYFLSDIKAILQKNGLKQIILMFDEIEFITHGLSGTLGQHWDSDFLPFWQTIRSVHQEIHGKLVFIVAGVNPACVETSHFYNIQNPIFQLASPHYLEPFMTPLVREMVRSIGKYLGLKFSEETYQYLQARYGGHPFLIRVACSEVWKKNGSLDPEHSSNLGIRDFQDTQDRIRIRLSAPIKDILLSLVWWYSEEYDLLRILASGDGEFVKSYLEQSPKSIFRFAQYGILKNNGSNEFAIQDLRDFLNSFGDVYKQEISPFLRGDMPPELLPSVPDLNIVGRLFEKRSEIEIKLRKSIIMYLSVKYTFDNPKISQAMIKGVTKRSDRPEPKDLFIGRTPQDVINQVYVPDLKNIIIGNWDIFSPLFDNKQDRFSMNMDTLNIARRIDSHTKPVTKQEMEEFANSYTWLQSRLAKISI